MNATYIMVMILSFLTDRIVQPEDNRGSFIYGKDILVETRDSRVDITKRQVWTLNEEAKS